MQSPVDVRIAADNAAARAVQRAMTPLPAPPLPDRALIGERLADHGDDTGREARTKMADALFDIVKQVGATRKNPTLNPAQMEIAVAEMVRGRVDRLLAECEEQGKVIDTLQRGVDAGIESALTPPRPEWHALGAEYRAVLRSMTPDERAEFIDRMQGTRHMMPLMYAVASVPAELSGASHEAHRRMHDTLLALKDPELLTRPGDLKKRRAALATVEDGIRRTRAELVDEERVAALRALAGGDVP